MAGRVIAIVGFGQNRKSYPSLYESALPLKPDIGNERRHVRFGPDSDTRFVIRSPSSRLRAAPAAREAKRLGGLEVDNQFVHGRSLNWQDGCLLALEDTIDAAGRLLV